MLTTYQALALLAVAAVAALLVWLVVRSRRRAMRYVPVGLISRRYVVWFPLPRRRRTPVPVVLAFHGGGGSPEQLEEHAALHAVAAARDFVIVYPEGYHRSWNAGRCCGDAQQSAIDEVRFTRAILDDLASILNIDRQRIYATGFSNGAMLCYYLACNMSEEIAAIAPVAGAMFVSGCAPRRPVAIFHLHGLADEWAPYDGGKSIAPQVLPPVEAGIAFWRRYNGLTAASREPVFDGLADCTIYSSGPQGTPIRVCAIPGLGHHWPGGAMTPRGRPDAAAFGPFGPAIDLREVNTAILRFLAAHSLPEPRLQRIRLEPDRTARGAGG